MASDLPLLMKILYTAPGNNILGHTEVSWLAICSKVAFYQMNTCLDDCRYYLTCIRTEEGAGFRSTKWEGSFWNKCCCVQTTL